MKERHVPFVIVIGILIISISILFILQLLGIDITNESLLLITLVFVIYLVVAGFVSEFRFGSVEVKLRNIGEIEIPSGDVIDNMEEPNLFRKEGIVELKKNYMKMKSRKGDKILLITEMLDDEKYYDVQALNLYLKSNIFKYVLFKNSKRDIAGYMCASELMVLFELEHTSGLFENESDNIIDKINKWRIHEIPGIRSNSIERTCTILGAIYILEGLNVEYVAVGSTYRKFEGFVTLERLKSRYYEEVVNALIGKKKPRWD